MNDRLRDTITLIGLFAFALIMLAALAALIAAGGVK